MTIDRFKSKNTKLQQARTATSEWNSTTSSHLQTMFTDIDCRNDQHWKFHTIHLLLLHQYVSRRGLSDILGGKGPNPMPGVTADCQVKFYLYVGYLIVTMNESLPAGTKDWQPSSKYASKDLDRSQAFVSRPCRTDSVLQQIINYHNDKHQQQQQQLQVALMTS